MTQSPKSKFMFDQPYKSDWLFWVFIALLGINLISAFSNSFTSINNQISSINLVSGSIDLLFRAVFSWVIVSPIYWVRRSIRKQKTAHSEMAVDPIDVEINTPPEVVMQGEEQEKIQLESNKDIKIVLNDSEDSSSTLSSTDKPDYRFGILIAIVITLAFAAIGLESALDSRVVSSTNVSNESTYDTDSKNTSGYSYDSPENNWIPEGFYGWDDGENLAWKWPEPDEITNDSRCKGSSCWGAIIVSRLGCPNGLSAVLSITNNEEVQIDFSRDEFPSALPLQRTKLIFMSMNSDAKFGTLSQISCS